MIKPRNISPYLTKISFPQRDFAMAISRQIRAELGNDLRCLVDAPCGMGQTTLFFADAFPAARVVGIDIDPELIGYAKRHFQRDNIQYVVKDVQQIASLDLPEVDVFCVINSIFLLPDMDKLFSDIRQVLKPDGWLIVLVPNVEGDNYKHFVTKHSSTLNLRQFSASEAGAIFDRLGFRLLKTDSIIRVRIFGGVFRRAFFFFFPFLVRLFDAQLKQGTPAYHILFSKRKATSP